MTKTLQILAAALLVSVSAASSFVPMTAGAQDLPSVTKTITITSVISFDGGVIVRHVSNNGKALTISDMSTISDAKLQKLQDAGDSHTPLTVVTKGNVIIDIL